MSLIIKNVHLRELTLLLPKGQKNSLAVLEINRIVRYLTVLVMELVMNYAKALAGRKGTTTLACSGSVSAGVEHFQQAMTLTKDMDRWMLLPVTTVWEITLEIGGIVSGKFKISLIPVSTCVFKNTLQFVFSCSGYISVISHEEIILTFSVSLYFSRERGGMEKT
mmetsp:Transcript_6534/g.8636  ORF Transcript_6534/g.8636 Transcript_6534/m.8636 type:complete len:165 (-) Transcript_6534:537-1031(-)